MTTDYKTDDAEREALLAPIEDGANFELFVNYMDFHDPERDAVSLKDAKLFDICLIDDVSGAIRPVTPMKDFEDCLSVVEAILAAHGDRVTVDRQRMPAEVVEHIDSLQPLPRL